MVGVKTGVLAVAHGGRRPWGTPSGRPFRRAGGDSSLNGLFSLSVLDLNVSAIYFA